MGKNNLRRGQCHRPTLHRKAVDLSLFQESLFASQPFNVTLPTSTTCSAFPALASAATALGSQKMPWHRMDPSSEQWGLQPPPWFHQARLAAMLMHRHTAVWSNGHCSTKLTVHLLLTADAGESGL